MRSPRTAPPPAIATRKPRWPPSTAERSFQTAKLLPSAGILLFALHWNYELNALENWYCSTSFWRWMTRERLLPWLLVAPTWAIAFWKSAPVRAASLPFANRTFTAAVAVLVLHHLRSSELQDRAFAEVHRVLQPGGEFFAFEIPDGWFNRVIHIKSTFVPIQPNALAARLANAGFGGVVLDRRPGGFSF